MGVAFLLVTQGKRKVTEYIEQQVKSTLASYPFHPLTPELNPSAQRCLTRFFYWGFFFLNSAFR
jgi:hypothetical protein